jgi:hypothetical protein
MIKDLKIGDYIAFEWSYGVSGKEIIVDSITMVKPDEVLVHFLYGYKSESQWVKKKDIIAVGDPKGKCKIKGWSGKFNIVLPDHELLKEIKKN